MTVVRAEALRVIKRSLAQAHSRHCERSEAIHLEKVASVDCFATLAMTLVMLRAGGHPVCIPHTVVVEFRTRGVLGRQVKPGDDSGECARHAPRRRSIQYSTPG